MASSPSVEDFVNALQTAPTYPSSAYADRLQTAVKDSPAVSLINAGLPSVPNTSDSAAFDGQDCSTSIQNLAVATCARGLSQVKDNFGFAGIVDYDNVVQQSKVTVTSLIPYTVADWIDAKLAAAQLPALGTLKTNTNFVQAFNEELSVPTFIKKVNDQDTDDAYFGMSLLFAYQFFRTNGKYEMIQVLDADDTTSVHSLAQTWFETLTPGGSTDAASAAKVLLWTASCVSSVYAENGLPDTSGLTAATRMLPQFANANPSLPPSNSIVSAMSGFGPAPGTEYNSLSAEVWGAWDGRTEPYVQAMLNAVMQTNVTTEQGDHPQTFCHGGMAASCSTIHDYYTTTHTRYGDAVASWAAYQQQSGSRCFKAQPPDAGNRTKTTTAENGGGGGDGGGGGSCFAPGTLVLTTTGMQPIEALREHDQVLTNTAERTIGICSDEVVAFPTSSGNCPGRTMLFGFNEEKPFFTAGHVFYTTTGLRAIDPQLAKKENPWLVVGRLQVGHVLLHAERIGDQYRRVHIYTMHAAPAECDAVYGVHLREGMRSYHANGYLVRLNYPEITIKALAADILALPQVQQLQILRSARELSPMFHRFGGETLLQALSTETKSSLWTPPKKCKPQRPVDLRHMHRKWALQHVDTCGKIVEKAKKLPTLHLTDGILHVDGEYCERASVHARTLRWSRPMPTQHQWEHGSCSMNEHAVAGQGHIFTSDEADASEPPVIKDRVRFVASVPRKEYVHTDAGRAPQSLKSNLRIAAPALRPEVNSNNHDDDDDDATFALSYGQVMPTGGATQPPSTSLFDVVMTSTTPSTGGAILPDVQIPVLERLQSLLQSQLRDYLKISSDPAKITRLYEVTSTLDDKNDTLTTINLLYPDLVYRACDDAYLDTPARIYKDLTFKTIGFGETLPLLFSSMSFAYNWDGTQVNGSVIHYDPEKPGTHGDEFTLSGTYKESSTFSFRSRHSATAAATKSFLRPGHVTSSSHRVPRAVFDSHSAPAPATMALAAGDSTLSAQNLAELSPWDDAEVHAQSQTLLYRTMLYHIDDSYRSTFFQEAKPDNLDPQLSTGLSEDVKDWIQNVYGPAYICNRLNGVDDVTKSKWRRQFTADEQKRLRWFWVGKGSKSIYCAPQYTALNEVTAAVAVRTLHPILQQYIDDTTQYPDGDGKVGGEYWSTALYKSQCAIPNIGHLVANFRLGAGSSLLSKHCNVMHALDADKTNANLLADKVRRKIEGDTSNLQRNTADDSDHTQQDEYMWLNDSMYQLILGVLNNDPKLNADVKNSLQKDIDTLMAEWNVNTQQGNDQKATQILNNSAAMVNQMAALIRSMRLASPTMWAGLKGWAKATKVGSLVANGASNPKIGAAMKGLMILTGVANFLRVAIGAYRDWSKLDASERAALVLDTLAVVCQTAGGALELWEMIKEMRQDTPAEQTVEQTAATGLDDEQRQAAVESDKDEVVGSQTEEENTEQIGTQVANDTNVAKENPNQEADPLAEASAEQEARLAKIAKNFNTAGTYIRAALIVVAAATTIVMCIQVAKNWSDMKTVDRILAVGQIVQQGLAFLVDTAGLVSEGLFAFGQIAAETLVMVSTCLAWAGAFLAVVGLVLMIALMIWDATKEPPLSPVEQWIQDHGTPFLDGLEAPPNQLLSYSAPSSAHNGDVLTFTATNATDADITVAQISVYFQTGDDASTLTTEDKFVIWASDTDWKAGDVRLQPVDGYILAVNPNSSQTNAQNKPITREKVIVSGVHDTVKNPSMNVTIPAKGSLEIQVYGTISAAGPSVVEIEEMSTDATPVSSFYTVNKQ